MGGMLGNPAFKLILLVWVDFLPLQCMLRCVLGIGVRAEKGLALAEAQ